jgi:uncharacterized membrane protein (UPF0127 family)
VVNFFVDEIEVVGELAATLEDRAKGLSGRLELPEAMLFVFEEEAPRTFWMKGCFVPLEIAFFDREGHLFQIESMPLGSRVKSKKGAFYALEVAPGWFAEHGIGIGASLKIGNP